MDATQLSDEDAEGRPWRETGSAGPDDILGGGFAVSLFATKREFIVVSQRHSWLLEGIDSFEPASAETTLNPARERTSCISTASGQPSATNIVEAALADDTVA